MFKEKTVIILGAGASCHYGYPSGEKLIDNLIINAHNIVEPFENHYYSNCNNVTAVRLSQSSLPKLKIPFIIEQNLNYDEFIILLKELRDSLQSFDPVMIDSFLNDNPSLRDIGKIFIAYEILKCENTNNLNRTDIFKGNWYRYLVDSIVSECVKSEDILNNNLNIITFNYDVSLEHYLYTRLTSIERFTKADVMKFLNNSEKPLITHVYGKVRENPFENTEYGRIFKEKDEKEENEYKFKLYKHTIELACEASKNLEVINKEKTTKLKDSLHLNNARQKLKEATRVFIIGFGFYEDNMDLIGLTRDLVSNKTIYYTNFNDLQKIERKIKSKLGIKERHEDYKVIKSTRNVYDALTYDFDFI